MEYVFMAIIYQSIYMSVSSTSQCHQSKIPGSNTMINYDIGKQILRILPSQKTGELQCAEIVTQCNVQHVNRYVVYVELVKRDQFSEQLGF